MKVYVSIIMPTHTGADKIARSIQSVMDQTFSDFELIIVDDNGKGSVEQIKTYKAVLPFLSDDRVKYIVHKVNKNGAAARNTGISAAIGKYIAFLDDDDIFTKNKIQEQYQIMENSFEEVGLVYGSYILHEREMETSYIYNESGNILFPFLLGKIDICSSTLMIRKSVLVDVKGFDESFARHQDWEFIARILYKYNAACIKNICAHKYAISRNSAKSATKIEEYRMHYIKKISYVIDSLPLNQRNQVYDSVFFFIAKSYLKEHNILKTGAYIARMKNPIYGMSRLIKGVALKLLNK